MVLVPELASWRDEHERRHAAHEAWGDQLRRRHAQAAQRLAETEHRVAATFDWLAMVKPSESQRLRRNADDARAGAARAEEIADRTMSQIAQRVRHRVR